MILVSFKFVGADVVVEVIGNPRPNNKIHENDILTKLEPDAEAIILKKDEEKYLELYKWCETNTDFKNAYKKRYVNFVFKD